MQGRAALAAHAADKDNISSQYAQSIVFAYSSDRVCDHAAVDEKNRGEKMVYAIT